MKTQIKSNILKTLQIIHFALMFGQIILVLLVWFLTYNGMFPPVEIDFFVLLLIALIFFLISTGTGFLLFQKNIELIRGVSVLSEKIEKYQQISLIRYMLFESSSILAIVFFLLTAKIIFCGIVVAVLVLFIIYRPKKELITTDLNLTYQEQDEIFYDSSRILK